MTLKIDHFCVASLGTHPLFRESWYIQVCLAEALRRRFADKKSASAEGCSNWLNSRLDKTQLFFYAQVGKNSIRG